MDNWLQRASNGDGQPNGVTAMIMADTLKNQLIESWETTTANTNAIELAKQSGAELHPVKGDCTIAEFMDGSFALIANNGNAILCTGLEADTVSNNS